MSKYIQLEGLGFGLPSNKPAPQQAIRVTLPEMSYRYPARSHSMSAEIHDYSEDCQETLFTDAIDHTLRKTVSMQFPMPPFSDTVELSCWSPSTASPSNNSPTFSDISDKMPPMTVHPCLHLLSPKALPLAHIAHANLWTAGETMHEAADFGWLVSLVESGNMPRSPASTESSLESSLPSPRSFGMLSAPAMSSQPSRSSVVTAATSFDGDMDIKVMSRARPIQKAKSTYFGPVNHAPKMRNSKSCSLLEIVEDAALPRPATAHIPTSAQSAGMLRSRSRVPLAQQSTQDFSALWRAVEQVEVIQAPQENATSPRNRVARWLGNVRKTKSSSPVSPELMQAFANMREPAVRRTKSIEALLIV